MFFFDDFRPRTILGNFLFPGGTALRTPTFLRSSSTSLQMYSDRERNPASAARWFIGPSSSGGTLKKKWNRTYASLSFARALRGYTQKCVLTAVARLIHRKAKPVARLDLRGRHHQRLRVGGRIKTGQ
jgi:hypothetical protein